MALMSLRSHSHVKASMVLTRTDHFIYKLYKITSKYYCKTYFIGNFIDGDRTRGLLPVCMKP